MPTMGGPPLQAAATPVIAPWCESDFEERGAVIVSFVDERLERDGKSAIKQFSGKSGQGQRNYRRPAALPARPGPEEPDQRIEFADPVLERRPGEAPPVDANEGERGVGRLRGSRFDKMCLVFGWDEDGIALK